MLGAHLPPSNLVAGGEGREGEGERGWGGGEGEREGGSERKEEGKGEGRRGWGRGREGRGIGKDGDVASFSHGLATANQLGCRYASQAPGMSMRNPAGGPSFEGGLWCY